MQTQRSSVWFVTGLLMIGVAAGRGLPPLALRFGAEVPVPDWSPSLVLALGTAVAGLIAWPT